MNIGSPTDRSELEALLARAREAVANMTPEERSSMYASQALGYIMSELVMSVHEEHAPKAAVRHQLERMRDALEGNADVYLAMPEIVERAWRLTPRDKQSMKQRIENAIRELEV